MTTFGQLTQIPDVLLPGFLMSNVLDVFPDYAPWAADVLAYTKQGDARRVAEPPFPALQWDADQREQMVWLADHPEAGAWVPTLAEHESTQEQLRDARGRATEAARQRRYAELGAQR